MDKILSNCESVKTAVINILEFYTQVRETHSVTGELHLTQQVEMRSGRLVVLNRGVPSSTGATESCHGVHEMAGKNCNFI